MNEYEIDTRILYYLVSGMSYREIANKYYLRQQNKVIYEIRKLLKTFKLRTRKELITFAIIKKLIIV